MSRGTDRMRLAMSALMLGALCPAPAVAAPDEVEATRLADTTTERFTFGGSRPREFTRVGERVFFAAGTRLTGRELWVTDGTEEGTQLVVELVPGAGDSGPRNLRAIDGFLYFEAETAARGPAAWRSDGTPDGTVPVDALPDLPPGPDLIPGTDDVRHLEFFSAQAEGKGYELFRTDGTVDGTYLVKDIYAGEESSLPGQFTRVGDIVFFSARTAEHGIELWKTDGTAQGTQLVKDARPGPDYGATRHLAAFDDRLLLFSGWSEEHQTELWRSDGTEEGTYMVKDLAPGFHQSGDPHDIRDMGDGTAYFAAATDLALFELWRTDGTEEGTYLVRDIEPDLGDAEVDNVVGVTDGVLFTAGKDPNSIGAAYWATDGTTAGTVLRDLSLTGGDAPRASVALADGAIGFGSESALFVSESLYGPGTMVFPSLPEPSTTVWGRLIPFGERALFQINTGVFPRYTPELWITDGTAEGSHALGSTSRSGEIEDDYAYLGNSVYIATEGEGLQRTDGTFVGTEFIAAPDGSLHEANSVVAVGERVLCVGEHGSTQLTNVFAYTPGDEHMRAVSTVDVRQFEVSAARQLRSLWGIGTTALFMRASVDEMWKSDGTDRGTSKVADVVPGWGVETGRSDVAPVRVGSRVLFAALTPEHGLELWCLQDGELGATLVADIAPGAADSVPMGLVPLGSSPYAVFCASDGERGAELWITDGTPGGTTLLSDVRPGPESSNPRRITQAGTSLFFAASGDAAGNEPWSVSLAGLGLPDSAFDGSRGSYVSDDQPGGLPPLDLEATRVRVKLDFRRDARDRITVDGAWPLPDAFDPEGEVVVIQIEDFTEAFALDRKGRAKGKGSRFELRGWKRSPAEAHFRLKLSGGLQEMLQASGFTEDAGRAPTARTLRVSILVAGEMRLVDVPMSYRVKRRRGKAKNDLE